MKEVIIAWTFLFASDAIRADHETLVVDGISSKEQCLFLVERFRKRAPYADIAVCISKYSVIDVTDRPLSPVEK